MRSCVLDFLWHPRFEPFVSSVVVNVAAVVVIGAAVVVIVAVIVAAVVVESLVGLAKVRLMANAKKPRLVSSSRRNRRIKRENTYKRNLNNID
ncbi:hypothetical protein Tco_0516775 [Tanacetum coccineum]